MFKRKERYCKIYLEEPDLDYVDGIDPIYFEVRIPTKLLHVKSREERSVVLKLFMDMVRMDISHVLTGHIAKILKPLLVFVVLSFAGCDDGTNLPRPGVQIDTNLCDVACVRLDECYDLASMGEDLGECIETCDYVTQEETDCFEFCDPLNGCNDWFECLEGC